MFFESHFAVAIPGGIRDRFPNYDSDNYELAFNGV